MTRTLTITSDEWASVHDGHLWIVRKGGRPAVVLGCASPAEDGVHSVSYSDGVGPCEWCGAPVPPPADLMAAAAPCETCGGSRRLWHIGTAATGPSEWRGCPDCRITLVGECPTCDGTGSVEGRNIASYDACWMDNCFMGRVTLGYAYPVSDVLPIVGGLRGPFSATPGDWLSVVNDHVLRQSCADGMLMTHAGRIDLAHHGDPAGLVGKWALQLAVQP